LFVVLLIVLHPTQELEPPANPGRFNLQTTFSCATHLPANRISATIWVFFVSIGMIGSENIIAIASHMRF
jgi:hypothetical protein